MQIYLPVAEMTVPAETILALGTVVGFLSGVFGVGGRLCFPAQGIKNRKKAPPRANSSLAQKNYQVE